MDEREEQILEEELAGEVQRLFESLVQELGETFSRELLRAEVGYRRVRPQRTIEDAALPVGTTGCCVAFKDLGVIFVRKGLEPRRSLATELHECAHLLLNHVPVCALTYEEFLHFPDLQYAVYRNRVTTYKTAQETSAEMLGRLITKRVMDHEDEKRKRATPLVILDLWEDNA